jgi:hypothetical protein
MTRITRVEVIDENGRSYVSWEDDNDVSWQFQDDGRTLKVFVNKVKQEPKTLYQMFYDDKWTARSCRQFCDIVEKWMSQYSCDTNKWDEDYKCGFLDCIDVLRKNLK